MAHMSMLVGKYASLECSSDSTVPGAHVPSLRAERCWPFREVGKEWEAAPASLENV